MHRHMVSLDREFAPCAPQGRDEACNLFVQSHGFRYAATTRSARAWSHGMQPNAPKPGANLTHRAKGGCHDLALRRRIVSRRRYGAIGHRACTARRSLTQSRAGGDQPIALCVWHDSIDWTQTPSVFEGNQKLYQDDLNRVASTASDSFVRMRLRIKLGRARAFQNAVYESNRKRKPVRLILIAGRQTEIEDAATESSTTSARLVDDIEWFVHGLNAHTGQFKLVRSVEPLPAPQRSTPAPTSSTQQTIRRFRSIWRPRI